MTKLLKYDAARTALAAAHKIDEVTDIRDKAEAMQKYAIMAKDTELSRHATEIRLRAERRLGELMAEQPKAEGAREPGTKRGTTRVAVGPASIPFVKQGIDKHLADRARKAAAMPEEKYEAKIHRQVDLAEAAASAIGKAAHPKSESTGEVEWYTPDEYLDLVRDVLGMIDLDPASSDRAQKIVKADKFFTIKTDGLTQEWNGKVWLNPPYMQPHIAKFMAKMVDEVSAGRTVEAIMLTHNYTDTEWFHAGARFCSAICFTRGRVKFYNGDGEVAAPTQGQAFFYFGRRVAEFKKVFSSIGFVVMP
jgi:phage N-6-adenine-methyltransferase